MSKSVRIACLVGLAAIVAAVVVASISSRRQAVEAAACADPDGALPKLTRHKTVQAAPAGAVFEDRGRELAFADYRGTGLVVNFWATWCAPCVRELPDLDKLETTLGGSGVRVLAVSTDREGLSVVEPFFAKHGIRNLPTHVALRSPTFRGLQITAMPTTLLIDAEGREIGRLVGVAEWNDPPIAKFLKACLAPTRG
ncbi:MAG: TlpA family protein disulfide reductase [Rhodospirillales bacterium]|nr:TlpA family protein disulfide reductase [Rhodospirillales bacterium]